MDIQRLTIGEMAKLNNVTTETLRHYDRLGLIKPFNIDEETAYRYYHINQCSRLDMIQLLQSYNVKLKDISHYLNLTDSEAISDFLIRQQGVIEKNIQHLEQSHYSIKRMILNHQCCQRLPQDGVIFFESIPSRRIFKHQTARNIFEESVAGYELILRELKDCLIDNNLPSCYFFNAGTLIRRACLEKKHIFSNEVFFFVEDSYEGSGNLETLPECLYMCLCSKDFTKEAECAHRLIENLETLGYELAGDYVCEVIEEFPGFGENPRSLSYKIQIPINPSPTLT